MTAHIIVSVIGLALLIVYTIVTKKYWKLPAFEIVMRVFYGIALVSGIILMNVHSIVALSIVHKVCAALFVVLLVVLLTHKAKSRK